MTSVLRWKYRRKISSKYRGGERNAEYFERFKVYRLLLIRNSEH
jgi:hypothetical protein